MEDPRDFCICMHMIDVSPINCTGWGVVPTVTKLQHTCVGLQDPNVAAAISGTFVPKKKAQARKLQFGEEEEWFR